MFEANFVSAKLHRWRLSVLEFNFKVKYLEGAKNTVADTLSRINLVADVDEYSEPIIDLREIQRCQKNDKLLKLLYSCIVRNHLSRPSELPHFLWNLKKRFAS